MARRAVCSAVLGVARAAGPSKMRNECDFLSFKTEKYDPKRHIGNDRRGHGRNQPSDVSDSVSAAAKISFSLSAAADSVRTIPRANDADWLWLKLRIRPPEESDAADAIDLSVACLMPSRPLPVAASASSSFPTPPVMANVIRRSAGTFSPLLSPTWSGSGGSVIVSMSAVPRSWD